MGLINLFFSGGFNSNLWYFLLALLVTILLIIIDRFLFGLLPNFLIGISALVTLIFLGLWLGENFLKNLWKTQIGMGIIIAVSFILLALIITSSFSKKQSTISQFTRVISPEKIGKNIKNIRRR